MSEGALSRMMRLQKKLQLETYGIDYDGMDDEERIKQFKDMHIAITDELHEALGEMGWKPWAKSKHFDKAAVQAELIDAWHFFMNLMLIAGLTPDELLEQYERKRLKNMARQQEGYDGVTTKCQGCRRAYDDDAVMCHPSKIDPTRSCCHYTTGKDGRLI